MRLAQVKAEGAQVVAQQTAELCIVIDDKYVGAAGLRLCPYGAWTAVLALARDECRCKTFLDSDCSLRAA